MNGYMKSLACCALLWPALGLAASKSQQEYLDVIAAVPVESHGAELYAEHCASCHGADANGVIDGSTPRIAGQHFRVLVRQLIDFRYGKRWDFRMEAVATSLHKLPDAQDIADVAGYVSALDRSGARGVGDGTLVARGATVYGSKCQSCHGIGGEGDNSRSIPKIGGQHSAYLMRQVYDAIDGRRPPLGTTHRQRLEKLDFEDVRGLTDFIARMGWQDAPPAGAPDK